MKAALRVSAHAVIGVSSSAIEGSLGPRWLHRRRSIVIFNGVEPISVPELRSESGALRIAVVGRLGPEKNQVRAVAVAAALAEKRRVRLSLFGRGEARELVEVARRASSSQLEVAVLPEQPMREILADSDVLLAPSRREGLPGVVLEAVSAGVPVVASDIAPMAEVAQFLPIATLSLDLDDHSWAASVNEQANQSSEDLRAAFEGSPFDLESSHVKIRQAWGVDSR